MELDELKKSWNALDQHLDKHPLVSEEEMEQLIKAGKTHTQKQLNSLNLWQRLSLCMGVALLFLLLSLWLWTPGLMTGPLAAGSKLLILLAFLAVSIVAGLIWDWATYRRLRSIRIDQMSVVEVSRRMTAFQHHMRHEAVAACLWIVAFNVLYYWVMGYYLAPASTQALVIALLLGADAAILYVLYRKVMYKHLNDIRKNIEELKDICTE